MPMPTLGGNLSRMLVDLTDLLLKESDPKRKKQLRAQHRALAAHLKKLVDENVARDTIEYEKALESVTAANEALAEAKEDLGEVAGAIKKIAKALDLVAKVASKLG
jgi:hypothetical protein